MITLQSVKNKVLGLVPVTHRWGLYKCVQPLQRAVTLLVPECSFAVALAGSGLCNIPVKGREGKGQCPGTAAGVTVGFCVSAGAAALEDAGHGAGRGHGDSVGTTSEKLLAARDMRTMLLFPNLCFLSCPCSWLIFHSEELNLIH